MRQRLKQLLAQRPPRKSDGTGLIPSAVLVPLFSRDDTYYLLFTRRTQTVKTHKGQISFPGGVYEDKDGTLEQTALRESAEEIGLDPRDVEILGRLDDEPSATADYIITPYAGLIPWPYDFKLSEAETEEIIIIPVNTLLAGGCRPQLINTPEGKVSSYAYEYNGTIIWGATAHILKRFLDIFTEARV
ncbi:NUDIX hydrolase [Chloroflexota bacterium]